MVHPLETIFACFGAWFGRRLMFKKIRKICRIEKAEQKWLIFTLTVFLLQLAAIRFYYGGGMMAQGRYLYPVIIPVIILIYTGLKYIEQFFRFPKEYLTIAFIVFQAVFFLFAVARVISVFYLEIASPHLGL